MKSNMNISPGSGIMAIASVLLQRKTSSGCFLPQIDGLRFVAIATVFVVHVIANTLATLPNPSSSSWLQDDYLQLARGVELFFVLSGFVIAMPFIKHAVRGAGRVSLREFYIRRLTRLEPPFLIAMLLTYLGLVLVHHSSAQALFPHLLATCTYTHLMVYGAKSTVAFITWSLEIEIQFYLVAPLLLTVFALSSLTRRTVLIGLAIVSLVIQVLIASSHPVMAVSLIGYLPFFIAGILVCDLGITNGFWENRRLFAWDLIGLVAFLGAYLIPNSQVARPALLPFLFGLGVLAAFRGKALADLMAYPAFTAVGGMCYSIYLLHVPVVYLLAHLTRHAYVGHQLGINAGIQVLLFAVPVFLVSCVFFLCVEKPCMNKRWPHDLLWFFLSRVQNQVGARGLNG
jgi:peptidoglycan/LPS O-acetylase OafA/YrhL